MLNSAVYEKLILTCVHCFSWASYTVTSNWRTYCLILMDILYLLTSVLARNSFRLIRYVVHLPRATSSICCVLSSEYSPGVGFGDKQCAEERVKRSNIVPFPAILSSDTGEGCEAAGDS